MHKLDADVLDVLGRAVDLPTYVHRSCTALVLVIVLAPCVMHVAFADIRVLDVDTNGMYAPALWSIAAFESPAGADYLLGIDTDGMAHVVNVTNPYNPDLLGGIMLDIPDHRLPDDVNIEVFYTSNDRVYAVVGGVGQPDILDVTDPNRPTLAYDPHPDTMPDVALLAGVLERTDGSVHVLMMDMGNQLHIFDVTNPYRPELLAPAHDLGGMDFSYTALLATGDGSTYLVGVDDKVVWIVDVTDPIHPVHASMVQFAPVDWQASDVDMAVTAFESTDGRTYLAVANNPVTTISDAMDNGHDSSGHDMPTGIFLLDVTDPYSPVQTGFQQYDGGELNRVRVVATLESANGRLYAVAAGKENVVADVTDPYRPIPAGSLQDGEDGFDATDDIWGMAAFEVSNGTYLAVAGLEGIQIVGSTDGGSLEAVGSITNDQSNAPFFGGGGSPAVFEPGDGRTYGAFIHGDGILFVDITGPHLPVQVGNAYDGRDGFDTLDELVRVATFQDGGRTYVAAFGWEGIQVVDATSPDSPLPVGSLLHGHDGIGISVQLISVVDVLQLPGGNYLLIPEHDKGVNMVNVTYPRAPVWAGGIWDNGTGVWGGVHYMDTFEAADGRDFVLVVRDRGIQTVDVTDPHVPAVADMLGGDLGGQVPVILHHAEVFDMPTGGIGVLLADYGTGLHTVDVSDPTALEYLGNVPVGTDLDLIPGSDVDVVVSPNDRTYALVIGADQMGVVDITDPRILSPVADLNMDPAPIHLTLLERPDGSTHALAYDRHGVAVLDVTYPHAPVTLGAAQLYPWPHDVAIFESDTGEVRALVTAEDAHGMAKVVDLTDPRAPHIMGTVPFGGTPLGYGGGAVAVASPDGRIYGMWLAPSGPDAGGALMVTDITDPDPAIPIDHYDLGLMRVSAAAAFKAHDGRTYLMAGGGATISMLDVTYPEYPVWMGGISDNLGGFYALGGIRDIAVFESPVGRVYALVGGADGMQVMDVTNPYAPHPAGVLHETSAQAGGEGDGVYELAAVRMPDDRVLALSMYVDGRVDVLDVTNPHDPVRVGTIPAESGSEQWPSVRASDVSAFVASDGRAYALLTGAGGFRLVDISEPASPEPVALSMDGAWGNAVFESPGGHLHALLTGEWGVRIIYVDDPVRYYGDDA